MSKQQFYIPVFANLHQALAPYSELLIRVTAGGIFLLHGLGKFESAFFGEGLGRLANFIEPSGLPAPMVLAWLGMITEFFGGICLILGLFTRLWAFLGAGMMLLISFFIKGLIPFSYLNGGPEYEMVLAAILIFVVIRGAGAYSLDAKMKKVF